MQGVLRGAGFQRLAWRMGLADERSFWDRYLATHGLDWPEEYEERLRPDRAFPPHLQRLLEPSGSHTLRVLDVGSGPLTPIGTQWPGHRIELTAADPLAGWYCQLFDKHAVTPAIRPTLAEAEHLEAVFPRDHFDLVHARNCIDHCADPRRAIDSMLAVARSGAPVYLEHMENEGENEDYQGLHQWNFRLQGEHLVIAGRRASMDLSRLLAGHADVRCRRREDGWIVAEIRSSAGTAAE